MKRKRRLFGILLIITALIIMQLPVTEVDAATSASDFRMDGNKLVKYRGTEKNVSVPNTVEVIAEDAFEGNTDIELIVLPNSVRKIESYAFWGCENLENVVLGSGLTEVGDFVFANCKGLTHMSIPSNISNIGIQAFADCVNLTDINIAPEVTSIHESAFDGCYKLTIHSEPGTVADKYAQTFYEKQKEMPEYEDVSDYDTDEDDIDDKPEVESTPEPDTDATQDGAFLGSTKVVGNHAVVFIDNTNLQVLDGREDMEAIKAEQDKNTAVDGIAKYTIVDGSVVADQAYYRNQNLQGVTLPAGITEVGQFSFARSTVTEIQIPEGTRFIDYGAFYHCDNLANVTLPDTIENVEPKAFLFTEWVEDFMQNGEEDFLISGGVLVAYRGTAQQVVIPEGVRVIAGEVFTGHSEISEVSLPNSLEVIGEAAFADCMGLKNIYFGDGLRQIKDRAFAGCALSSVALPASVEALGLNAFDATVQIKYGGIHLPEQSHEVSAERLSNEAFRPCKDGEEAVGVTVVGMDKLSAHLEGAARSYTLTVAQATDSSSMERAFTRGLYASMPAGMLVYDMTLTDNSGVPITKLGKQPLQITMPVPEAFQGQNVEVYTLDRNGQLEEVEIARVRVDGVDCIRFTTNYVSQYGIVGDGTNIDSALVFEETTTLVDMSSAPASQSTAGLPYSAMQLFQWSASGILLLSGILCVLWRR